MELKGRVEDSPFWWEKQHVHTTMGEIVGSHLCRQCTTSFNSLLLLEHNRKLSQIELRKLNSTDFSFSFLFHYFLKNTLKYLLQYLRLTEVKEKPSRLNIFLKEFMKPYASQKKDLVLGHIVWTTSNRAKWRRQICLLSCDWQGSFITRVWKRKM